ncbi:MAG: hypothetical protein J7K36_10140 [Archaeoglobaceae archaeon]|nr:hypothetical protein [Archaeoglobaceae archaeon]
MNDYDIVDKILECLKDCKKHKIGEVQDRVCFDEFKFKKLVELLDRMGLINVEGDEVVITKIGLDYLNLPEVP